MVSCPTVNFYLLEVERMEARSLDFPLDRHPPCHRCRAHKCQAAALRTIGYSRFRSMQEHTRSTLVRHDELAAVAFWC